MESLLYKMAKSKVFENKSHTDIPDLVHAFHKAENGGLDKTSLFYSLLDVNLSLVHVSHSLKIALPVY